MRRWSFGLYLINDGALAGGTFEVAGRRLATPGAAAALWHCGVEIVMLPPGGGLPKKNETLHFFPASAPKQFAQISPCQMASCANCGRHVRGVACMCRGWAVGNAMHNDMAPGWHARATPKPDGKYWHPKTGWTKYPSPKLWGLSDHGLTPWHSNLVSNYRAPVGGQHAEGFTPPFSGPGKQKPTPWTAEALRHRQQIHDCCAPPKKKKRKREPSRKARKETRAAKQLRVAAERVREAEPVVPVFEGRAARVCFYAMCTDSVANGRCWDGLKRQLQKSRRQTHPQSTDETRYSSRFLS